MKRIGCIAGMLASGIWAVVTSGQPANLAQLSPSHPTEHFRITPNGAVFNNMSGAGGLLSRIEATHAAVTALAARLALPTSQPAEKMSVVLCTDREMFRGLGYGASIEKSDMLLGFFDRASDQTVLLDFTIEGPLPRRRSEISSLVNPVRSLQPTTDTREQARRDAILKQGSDAFAEIERVEEQLFRTVVQHEVAHLVLNDLRVLPRERPAPAWLAEGLAALFEGRLDQFSASDPGVNEFRLKDYRAAEKDKTLLPWRKVVGGKMAFLPQDGRAATAYAQAWVLAYWAVREQPEKLAAYIRAIQQRKSDAVPDERGLIEEFEAVFGPIADIEGRVTKFAAGLSLPGGK